MVYPVGNNHSAQMRQSEKDPSTHSKRTSGVQVLDKVKEWKVHRFEKLPNWMRDNEFLTFGHRYGVDPVAAFV